MMSHSGLPLPVATGQTHDSICCYYTYKYGPHDTKNQVNLAFGLGDLKICGEENISEISNLMKMTAGHAPSNVASTANVGGGGGHTSTSSSSSQSHASVLLSREENQMVFAALGPRSQSLATAGELFSLVR